mgnify:CR=1 FL=1|tara:strand:- start:4248 stop:4535 length:288 start_codon:yes stop_codon:yes gene_type:complete
MTYKVQINWERDSASIPSYTSLYQSNKIIEYKNTLGDAIIKSNWSNWVDNKATLKMEFDSEGTWTKLKNYSYSLNDSDGSTWYPYYQVLSRDSNW